MHGGGGTVTGDLANRLIDSVTCVSLESGSVYGVAFLAFVVLV